MITKISRIFSTGLVGCGLVALTFTSCDDQIMEWGTPEGHGVVTAAEIPLEVKAVLANYGDLKTYSTQYHPNTLLGLGIGAAIYLGEDGRYDLANANFQQITLGNAMKADALIANSGALNFTTVDNVIDALPEGMRLYGHNFVWHTQQNQTYLKSLIAPTLVVESGSDIQTVLAGDAANFDGGTTGGWGSWGSNKESGNVVAGAGPDGSAALVLVNKGDGNAWEAQCAYTFDAPLDPNTEYTIRFKAKSSTAAGEIQFQYQNGTTYGSQGGYNTFSVGTDWTTCEYSFTPAYDDANRIILNFGKVGGTYWIDDIEFGTKVEAPMDNVMAGDASDFEGGSTGGWGSWGSNKDDAAVVEDEAHGGTHSLMLRNKGDGNAWEAQCAYTFDVPLTQGTKYMIQFYAKSSSAAGELQFQYQNSTTYGSQGGYNSFAVGTDWILCEYEFTMPNDDDDRIILNFGKVGATYWIDDIKFGPSKDQSAAPLMAPRRAATSYYVLKTPEEKAEALAGALEGFIKGVAEHMQEKGVVLSGYDVINEPIADGNSNEFRGYNGVFGGSWTDDDDVTHYDAEPTETTEEGLSLNWGSGHWYWGYYLPDYAVKAFQYARKYLPAETKLFVNDYNLESSTSKLASLIKFVEKIDADNGSPIVDGIGTQMHITLSGTNDDAENNAAKVADLRAKVDAQFKTLAATGKLIRVTELDVSLGTSSPSSAQYQAQAEAYRTIFESYFANIPAAQQHGITIWSLTDADDEHEYWLNGQKPNLWDASFLRKWAYKGVADGLAGEDLGLQFGGEDYKAFYERQNVSETVK